jgi:hypothetical protein
MRPLTKAELRETIIRVNMGHARRKLAALMKQNPVPLGEVLVLIQLLASLEKIYGHTEHGG